MASECRLSAACSAIGRAFSPVLRASGLRCGAWKAMARILAAGSSSGERTHCRGRQQRGMHACGQGGRDADVSSGMTRTIMYRAVGCLWRARVQGAPWHRMLPRVQRPGRWCGRGQGRPKSAIPAGSDSVGTIGAIVKKNIRIIKEMRGRAPGWETGTRALR